MRKPVLLLSCFLCPALLLAAPARPLDAGSILQFTHTAWTEKDGLPGQARAIAQTPDGYLWIGTSAGLYRFDGVRFTAAPARGEAIGSSVASLLAARDGTLWIGFVSGGIGRLREGALTLFASGASIPEGGIAWLAEDSEGSIWASGPYGLVRFKSGEWRRVGQEMGYPAVGAQALALDREGTLWVATAGFNFHLSDDPKRTGTILKLAKGATQFSPTGLAVPWVQGLTVAPDGAVWAVETSTWTLRRLTPGAGPETIKLGASPMHLLFAGDQSLWVGMLYDGIRRVPAGGGEVEAFGPKDQLSGNIVTSGLTDREGNFWFVTDTGLDRFRPNKVLTLSEAQGLTPDRSTALQALPGGSVWIYSYDYGSITRFQDGKLTRTELEPYSASDTSRIQTLFVNPKGELWLGGSFKLAHQQSGRFEYLDVPDRSPPSIVEAAAESKSGDLWVTMTSPGATGQVLRRRGSEWTDVRAKVDLPAFRARVLYPDSAGRTWLGFENGEVAAVEGDKARRYGTNDGLRGGRITSIGEDRQGRIWVAAGSGLSRLDKDKDKFITLTQDNGLPGTSISAVLEDGGGDLWLAGVRGILRVSAAELEKAFASKEHRISGLLVDSQDGLRGPPRQAAPFPSATRAADGRLWFATAGGVAVIDPAKWPRNQLVPAVRIERVRTDDKEQDPSMPLRFPSRTRSLEIDYTALSLTLPERVRFRVKLEGYDTEWRGPLSGRTATYTNLPPRDYRFRVAASNDDGVWNEEGASLGFTIVPAFHQTRLFLALCIAAAAALAWAGFRWRVLQARSRLRLQFSERLAERTRIAQELHDTFLQGVLSASLQLHVAVDGVPAESPSRQRLDRVLELMRDVIDEGRRAVKGLRARGEEDLEEAFSRCGEELNTGGAVEFRVVGQGRVRPIVPAIREELYRIVREALINAFQHSGARRIEVEIEFARQQLAISVKDDGRGIEPPLLEAGREGHWGLVGMRERATRIAATLRVFSRPGAGTEVELSIPGKLAFKPR